MVFSSPIFLFKFLPLVLVVVLLLIHPRRQNVVLLLASLLFYAWGEVGYLFLLITSILVNYGLGLAIEAASGVVRKAWMALGIAFNLGLLIFFKYTGFLLGLVDPDLGSAWSFGLPLAISFFTFQGMSYIIDIYRKEHPAQRNPVTWGVLVSFFPHLIAGPIVRYKDIAKELEERKFERIKLVYGIKRFIIGLFKKAVIGDTLNRAALGILELNPDEISMGTAWLGMLVFALQIYYDFSGYSDMAIGLAAMFGFTFPENFRHPYTRKSFSDFWRYWHITLSNWFRDYLYIPLGGNKGSVLRKTATLFVTFLLMGIWHGATPVFVLLGVYIAVVVTLERLFLRNWLEKMPNLLQHAYVIATIFILMTIFRATSIHYLGYFLSAATGIRMQGFAGQQFWEILTPELVFYLIAGIVFSLPVTAYVRSKINFTSGVMRYAEFTVFFFVFLLSLTAVAAGTHQPFIYFRF